jgi:hypothetical protein
MKYIAISNLRGRDELYKMNSIKLKQFEKLFGKFDDYWDEHEDASDWIRKNCKFIDFCTCIA